MLVKNDFSMIIDFVLIYLKYLDKIWIIFDIFVIVEIVDND